MMKGKIMDIEDAIVIARKVIIQNRKFIALLKRNIYIKSEFNIDIYFVYID